MDNTHTPIGSSVSPRDITVPRRRTTPEIGSENSVVGKQAGRLETNLEAGKCSRSARSLDEAQPLDPSSFPNPPRRENGNLPATIPNVDFMLQSYRITVRYNVIKKKLLIAIPGLSGSPDNADTSALTQIISLATLTGMSVGQIPSILEVIGDRYQLNPVADWIDGKPWDGADRLQELYDTLTAREGFPCSLKEILVHRWLISAVAAALKPSGFRTRGVLTIQGPQSIGKTAWIGALVNDPVLKEGLLKLSHHLDAGNKDSIITAACHWIVEIGELDSSLRTDIARLKGFLTADRDKVRRPYARSDSEYPRRTVFCASVNDSNFLVDPTGNTRFWTIPVTKINYQHVIDMQQLFAQVAVEYEKGERWWLTPDEEKELEQFNNTHRIISVIHEKLMEVIDFDRIKEEGLTARTAVQMLKEVGIDNPTNPQCKDCNAVLRELFGDPKRINGVNKWRIPLKSERAFSPPKAGPKDALPEDRF